MPHNEQVEGMTTLQLVKHVTARIRATLSGFEVDNEGGTTDFLEL